MLYDALTAEENFIMNELRRTADEDGGFNEDNFVDNRTFLRYWEEEKTHSLLNKAFGDSLILHKTVNATISDDELISKMDGVHHNGSFYEMRRAIYLKIAEMNPDTWSDPLISNSNGAFFSVREIFEYYLFSVRSWIDNKYEGPDFEITLPNNTTLKIVNGSKVMKVLGRVSKACGDDCAEAFEDCRLRQSQVMNDARIKADLCLSIHPLDYMTASLNSNGWNSCMEWGTGEYCRGVIEMMNSPCVVVAYIPSTSETLRWYDAKSEKYQYWNSKRWREFFIVRPDMISGIKGYPYWNRSLEDEVIKWLAELFEPIFDVKYFDNIYHWDTHHTLTDENNNIVVQPSMYTDGAMYNDFYSGNEYHSMFSDHWNDCIDDGSDVLSINYCGATECVCCGERLAYFDSEGELYCSHCCEHIYCCKCGERIVEGDYERLNGDTYCYYCWENLPMCACCDNTVDDDDATNLTFAVGWDDETTSDVLQYRPWDSAATDYKDMSLTNIIILTICADCADAIFVDGKDEIYKEHKILSDWCHWNPIVPINRFTEYGLNRLFVSEDIEFFKAMHEGKTLSA